MFAGYGVYLSTFIVALASAIVPLVSIEAYLLVAIAVAAPPELVPLALVAAAGQMLGKLALYYAGANALRLPFRRYDAKLEAWRTRLEARHGRSDTLIFVSALTGFPPFYVLSVLAGMLRFRLIEFALWGFVGRALRFAVIAYFPDLLRRIWS